jgi:hypothetical protein
MSFAVVASVAFQLATYVPGLSYPDPFEVSEPVLDCAGTSSLPPSSEPVFPAFSRVTFSWLVSGNLPSVPTIYVESLYTVQIPGGTSYRTQLIASWNGTNGSGTFAGNGGPVFFEAAALPVSGGLHGCSHAALSVFGFYVPWTEYSWSTG